ncbi:hypothetical protein [Pseudonocardia charpentierae]|uniref:Restriction endonuclease n=1 Tax=Pseudonocardia charpentierae TaxID=3075545 RepID=A0ABU2NA63_9PSEU|nr:hypothetical protein [Pseudonocardia sp. DSM 45834]MDT0350831.1 hypothetical protein [Pseudonocardia sp. DSM 45834]
MPHAQALTGLWSQLRPQLPQGFEGITAVDVDLELAPADAPGFSRRPDLVVVRHDAGRDEVVECRLGTDGAYADRGAVTRAFRTLEPFAIEVDLDALI